MVSVVGADLRGGMVGVVLGLSLEMGWCGCFSGLVCAVYRLKQICVVSRRGFRGALKLRVGTIANWLIVVGKVLEDRSRS